jgi:hypothetical protein
VLSQSSYQSQSISSGSPTRPEPKSPWRGVYPQGVSDWPCAPTPLGDHWGPWLSVQLPSGCRPSAASQPSLRRPVRRFSAPFVGLNCIVAPHYLFPGIWTANKTSTHCLCKPLDLPGRKDLACYNNHVFGSAGRLAAAAGCRPRW